MEGQVELVVLALQGVAVPVQTEEDQEQPLAERQVALVVLLAHVVGVPLHSRLAVSQAQPVCATQVVELEWLLQE